MDAIAGALSYLIPGLGQIYQGRVVKGVVFFVSLYALFFYGMSLGKWKNVYLPSGPNAGNTILDDLTARDAASFDKAYVEAQYEALRELAGLFRAYATGGDDARIRQFAQGLLLTVRSHLDGASKLR